MFLKYGITVDFDNLGIVDIENAKTSMGIASKSKNKFSKRIKETKKNLKRKFNDTKRFFKLYPAFKKYCREIKAQSIK